ncbi:probable N-acetyltransferase HLS1 [Macadamia integrifolia]|uniref:probable N-acetyltransferase HLS1 n=1 Tax=Macadamia integrifolia TaxID=60698 RepID=UPI001C4E6299|nr:probable N-acetyltransferase HLS1 [Macadamia integrifolia]
MDSLSLSLPLSSSFDKPENLISNQLCCFCDALAFEMKLKIRSYDARIDRERIEDLERRCEVGPAESVFLFTDTLGDPICRIRNSPKYKMLVAELHHELVGVIQGSIKMVTICSPAKVQTRVGYILGLRVAPCYRRRGIGVSLVKRLEEWFVDNQVDFAYMATDKDNLGSVKLFTDKLGFIKFRTPSILVQPVGPRRMRISPTVKIVKLKIEDAERLYRRFMGSTEFFPDDIDRVLRNKLSLGTWVAYPMGESWGDINSGPFPPNWAMISVWNSGDLFKLRVDKAPLSCLMYAKSSRLIDRVFPCLRIPAFPDVFRPFGFYFMYGLHQHGPRPGKLVGTLCSFVHNMAMELEDCKVVVTEVGGCDTLKLHIPHWKLLSCADLWCIKPLRKEAQETLFGLTKNSASRALFVDPREV